MSLDISVNWLDSKISNHDYGISKTEALPMRPAYSLGSTLSFEPGIKVSVEIFKNFLVVMKVSNEFFDNEIRSSPLISKNYVIKSFFAINYVF